MKKIILVTFLFLVSCTPQISSLMTDSTCEMPCWNGIVPGKTTFEEALSILNSLSDVDKKTITVINSPWQSYDESINFLLHLNRLKWQEPVINGWANIKDEKVVSIEFGGKTGISFGEIIEKYGAPEGIVSVGSYRGKPIINAIITRKGIAFRAEVDETNITDETPVTLLVLFDPTIYQALLESGVFSDGNYNAEQTMEIMYPWQGYGSINEKYPLQQPTP